MMRKNLKGDKDLFAAADERAHLENGTAGEASLQSARPTMTGQGASTDRSAAGFRTIRGKAMS